MQALEKGNAAQRALAADFRIAQKQMDVAVINRKKVALDKNIKALEQKIDIETVYWEPFIKIGITSTTCMYACIVVLLFSSFKEAKLFKALQVLGKMTLTNYLLVSAIMIIILYGIGFGKLGELSMHEIWIAAVVWLTIEILFSSYWLKYFRYGPVEWIWRQLTYGKRLPLKK